MKSRKNWSTTKFAWACQRWPGKPVMDVQLIMKNLTDAKELIQSVMEELKPKG